MKVPFLCAHPAAYLKCVVGHSQSLPALLESHLQSASEHMALSHAEV